MGSEFFALWFCNHQLSLLNSHQDSRLHFKPRNTDPCPLSPPTVLCPPGRVTLFLKQLLTTFYMPDAAEGGASSESLKNYGFFFPSGSQLHLLIPKVSKNQTLFSDSCRINYLKPLFSGLGTYHPHCD